MTFEELGWSGEGVQFYCFMLRKMEEAMSTDRDLINITGLEPDDSDWTDTDPPRHKFVSEKIVEAPSRSENRVFGGFEDSCLEVVEEHAWDDSACNSARFRGV